MSMFGTHLAVLRQPLRAAGRSTRRLIGSSALVNDLPDGSALALVEERPSRDYTKPPALLKRLADAVRARGGTVEEHARSAARRAARLDHDRMRRAWGSRSRSGPPTCWPSASAAQIWETDVERGEMTRIADSELRKLATYAGERRIGVDDVEALTADTRPASVFAITNAHRPARAGGRGGGPAAGTGGGSARPSHPGSLAGAVSATSSWRATSWRRRRRRPRSRSGRPRERQRRQRLVDAARRYRGEELDAMLIGLFEADLAIKTNAMEEEPALVAWLGEHLLATRPNEGRR